MGGAWKIVCAQTQRTIAILIVLGIAFYSGGAAPKSAEPLLDFIRNAHRAALERIQTLECDVSAESGRDKLEVFATGHYCRSGDLVRIRQRQKFSNHEASSDVLYKNSVSIHLERMVGPRPAGVDPAYAGRRSQREAVFGCDVWRWMLFDFPSAEMRHMTLDEFIDYVVEPPRAERVTENGHEFIHLHGLMPRTERGQTHVEAWFDPSVNYLVRKQVQWCVNPDGRMETEIVDFVEPSPGIFIPAARVLRVQQENLTVKMTLTSVHVNEPIAADVFELRIPPGTLMRDHIESCEYRIGPDGQPAGPIKHVQREATLAQAKLDSPAGAQSPSLPSSKTPWPSLVIGIASLGAVTVALWILVSRRRREQNTAST
jgi:hypothetical protein